MTQVKFLLSLFIFALIFIVSYNNAKAALIDVNSKGEVIWQVLGDSTIEVKKVAEQLPSNNSPISLANTDGKVTLNGMDVTSLKDSLVEVEARGNTNNLKIGSSGNNFTIEENGITAATSFPITIDPVKNELTVTTASGLRLITVLPYEAALSLTRSKFMNNIKNNEINLSENSSGQLEYLIKGTKDVNLFNLAKIKADITSTVSASNGEVVVTEEPQWLKFFGFLFS